MDNTSLADKAVDTIAAVRAMGADIQIAHPERHAVRELKRAAEAILETALSQAMAIAHTAESLSREMRRQEEQRAAQKGQQ